MSERFVLNLGDCIDVMRAMPDNSVDAIVTDPPYELTSARPGGRSEATRGAVMGGFMGLQWDASGVAHNVEMWREALRVLKPGGHLLAFSGSRTYHRMTCAIEDAGFEVRDQIMWVYGSGFPKSHNGPWGGTALKPAHEPIAVARKPLVGTVAENHEAYGTGALNIDACRVEPTGESRSRKHEHADVRVAEGSTTFAATAGTRRGGDPSGRWPANLIHDGSAEVVALFPEQESGSRAAGVRNGLGFHGADGDGGPAIAGSSGSASRFFYCAKANRKDRNDGLRSFDLPAVTNCATMRDRENADWSARNGNHHPTVKPTDLMAYLVRLVTPPGGLVLDPFMGSGSTGKACMREGFRFIGIDMTPEYVEIARARIQHELAAVTAAAEAAAAPIPQRDLFEEVA